MKGMIVPSKGSVVRIQPRDNTEGMNPAVLSLRKAADFVIDIVWGGQILSDGVNLPVRRRL
jgi:hypothetical protein